MIYLTEYFYEQSLWDAMHHLKRMKFEFNTDNTGHLSSISKFKKCDCSKEEEIGATAFGAKNDIWCCNICGNLTKINL